MATEENFSFVVIIVFAILIVIIAFLTIPTLSSGISGFLSKALD
jgi:phosphotransferase system  glucose/maltose/N-acetylglucosamine-specific IIC component